MHPFRSAVESGNQDAVEDLLADDVLFTSPGAWSTPATAATPISGSSGRTRRNGVSAAGSSPRPDKEHGEFEALHSSREIVAARMLFSVEPVQEPRAGPTPSPGDDYRCGGGTAGPSSTSQ